MKERRLQQAKSSRARPVLSRGGWRGRGLSSRDPGAETKDLRHRDGWAEHAPQPTRATESMCARLMECVAALMDSREGA